MDAELVIGLRFAERLLAVAIGGLAILLGYRLFRSVPEAKDSEGRVTLSKDFTVVVSRVGPGVFFALFGVIVVGLSLWRPVSFVLPVPGPVAGQAAAPAPSAITFSGAASAAEESEADARRDKRLQLRREIALLNELPARLDAGLPQTDRDRIERALARIKFELMRPVWGEPGDGWDTPQAFAAWLEGGRATPPPAAIAKAVNYFSDPNAERSP